MKLVECWIEHPVRSLDRTYTYLSEWNLEPGMRVRVDFNGRETVGFVESVEECNYNEDQLKQLYPYGLKKIGGVMDEHALITEELHDLAMWMAETTLSTRISCFQAMLPAKIKPVSGTKTAVMDKWVRISDAEVDLTPKQLDAYMTVREKGSLKYSELRKQFPNQARQLVEKGALILENKEKEAVKLNSEITSHALKLKPEQQAAMNEIEGSDDSVYLIHGVTGSGKTEVYLQLAEKALNSGRQVLILVPEIGLTPQMIERVSSRFGLDLAIYHSALNDQEKYEQYRKVQSGRASIVVGTRSAVFLPFNDLGLIIMDEEHDSSYKQENQPAYHCRDVAIWRGNYHNCKVILGSATPSLESYARGMKNVYHLITMRVRINATRPDIQIVPLKQAMMKGESYILSDLLKQKMDETLKRGEQVILLLNRRGYSTMLRCQSCKTVLTCPHCDLAMSYHREERMMKCHACGYTMRVPKICPTCGQPSDYSSYGFGTEKLEAEVKTAFPNARILRMDADTTSRKNSHERILKQFGNHEADILLGTQMIAKGLDYPDVTLVGILNGDEGVGRLDYRSCEMTFDLLMQASGRSGRADKEGNVVLQVFDPDHYVVQCAVRQDYITFFNHEMMFRKAGQYPPYTYMIALTIVSKDQKKADETALRIKNELNGSYKTIGVVSLLKIQDRYRNRIILKGKNLDEMREDVRKMMQKRENISDIRIDVNPMVLD